MQVNDLTQRTRHVRALLTSDDLKMALANYVAGVVGVSITDPGVRVQAVDISWVPLRAEIILEIDPS